MNTDNMKKRIRLSESDLHRVIKESVYRILRESKSFRQTISSIEDLCKDLNMKAEFGQEYVYDGIPTLPLKLTANNCDEYDIDEILDYLEHYTWVTPPNPKYYKNSHKLIVTGEIAP